MKYFIPLDNVCFSKEEIFDIMKSNGVKSMQVHQAVPVKIKGMFFCSQLSIVGEKGDCGKCCPYYEPRNGKSGNCKHNRRLYEYGKLVTLNVRKP